MSTAKRDGQHVTRLRVRLVSREPHLRHRRSEALVLTVQPRLVRSLRLLTGTYVEVFNSKNGWKVDAAYVRLGEAAADGFRPFNNATDLVVSLAKEVEVVCLYAPPASTPRARVAARSCFLTAREPLPDVVLPWADDVSLGALLAASRGLWKRVSRAGDQWKRETARVFLRGQLDDRIAEDPMERHAALARLRGDFARRVDVTFAELADILGEKAVDVLVVPSNRELRPFGGALGAVFALAGSGLVEDVRSALGSASLGAADCVWLEQPLGLPLRGIVFAAGPYALFPDLHDLLRRTYRNALRIALDNLDPIARPSSRPPLIACVPISTGGNRVEPNVSAHVAMLQAKAALQPADRPPGGDAAPRLVFVANELAVVREFQRARASLLACFGATDGVEIS